MCKTYLIFSTIFILVWYSKCTDEVENIKVEMISPTIIQNSDVKSSSSPPETMINIYNSLTDPETRRPSAKVQYEANTIQALLEQEISLSDLFKFDITTIKPGELQEAELHIYILDSRISTLESMGSNYYLLRIYQVMSSNGSLTSLNPDVHRLLNVHYIPVNLKGWQIFKVKGAVESWLNGTFPNLGFLISATTIFGQSVEFRVSRRDIHEDEHQPNLIIYLKDFSDSDYPDIFHISQNYQRKKLTIPHLSHHRLHSCHLEKFDINFKQIGWDFISYPTSFSANLCLGKCNNGKNSSDTPHAALMKLVGNSRLPHCVPQKLNPINILYFYSKFVVIFKTFEGLSIENCHCR